MWFLWDNPLVTTFIRLDNLVGMHQGPPGATRGHQGPYYCNFHQFPITLLMCTKGPITAIFTSFHCEIAWQVTNQLFEDSWCWQQWRVEPQLQWRESGCAPKYSDTIMCKVYRLALIRTMPLILNLAAHSVLANSNFDCHFSPLRTPKASKKLSTEHKHMSNLAATALN